MTWEKRKDIMLCQPLDDHNLERLFKECPILAVQPKLDGIRCWVDWTEGKEKFFDADPVLISSQGNPIEGLPHIKLALKEMARATGQHLKWDGELYCHNLSFEEICSRVKRTTTQHEDYLAIQYYIFDVKEDDASYSERVLMIAAAFTIWDNLESQRELREVLQQVYTVGVSSERQLTEKLEEFVRAGYEGIIIRLPTALYKVGRPWTILKWKPGKFDWYKIEDKEEVVSKDGIHLERVGALVCSDRFGNTFKVGMGLGITKEKAATLWKQPLAGKWAKVAYQNLTERGVPRFGKAVEITDECGEEEGW